MRAVRLCENYVIFTSVLFSAKEDKVQTCASTAMRQKAARQARVKF